MIGSNESQFVNFGERVFGVEASYNTSAFWSARDAAVKAEALREAAAALPFHTRRGQTEFLRRWLRTRADRIEGKL